MCTVPFPEDTKRCCLLLPCQEIITIIMLHLGRFSTGQVHMPYQHLDCNIPHNRQVPDVLWSMRQIGIKYLDQEHKHRAASLSLEGLELTVLVVERS